MSEYDLAELVGKRIVCAADQRPFEHNANEFCVLAPICTPEGDELEHPPEAFANRGRVWWMLSHGIDRDLVRPGTLCEIVLERGVPAHPEKPDADLLQARRSTVELGCRHLADVFFTDTDPELSRILDGQEFPCARNPLARVVLVGPRVVMGPFHPEWEPANDTVTLQSGTLSQVWILPRRDLPDGAIREYRFTANQWDRYAAPHEVVLSLMTQAGLDLLQQEGDVLDAADNATVVNWGLKAAELSRREKREVKDLLDRVGELADIADAPPGRMDRLRSIVSNAQSVLALGADTAHIVGAQSAFEELVEKHVAEITKQRVEEEVGRRRAEVEREIERDLERRERLVAANDQLQKEFERERDVLQERLEKEKAGFVAKLDERARRIEEAEKRLAQQEEALTERLKGTLESYEKGADEIAARIIAELPILRKLGLGGGEGRGSRRQEAVALPPFLELPRTPGGLDEAGFLQQFAEVTRHHGFVFDRDDLANFHVSVKTGAWTVLAGPSGTGKSTLPRLYAEALGMGDELLWVPVRPDWLDDRDVIGAFNSLTSRFEPASCGLVERLIAATHDYERRRGGIYLVCLDEMNLARVEHYFAQFLSVLELPLEQRVLTLMSSAAADEDDPLLPYRRLPIAPNVRFVGTVNVDETTHFFSPKIIDRTSLLVLEPPDLRATSPSSERGRAAGLATVTNEEYAAWIRPPEEAHAARSFLLEIDELLREHRSGLGHRTMNRMLTYVASSRDLLSSDRALDLAISQVILPRLKVTAPRFKTLLDHLLKKLPTGRFERAGRIVERLLEEDGQVDFFRLI